ncbi:MAG: transposase, partial [Patescibacteria group bacterium]
NIIPKKYKLSELNKIFIKHSNYKFVNFINDIKLRNNKDGLRLEDALIYRFMYSDPNSTKESITSHINYVYETTFDRQTFDSKENNIGIDVYLSIFEDIFKLVSTPTINLLHDPVNTLDIKNHVMVGIDGTYNLDYEFKQQMNLCMYDITNSIPIYLTNNSKNTEIKSVTDLIKGNLDLLKNSKYIFIFDRGYHSKDFFNFLNNNGLLFIIRCKNNCKQNLFSKDKFRFVNKDTISVSTFFTPKKEKSCYKVTTKNKVCLVTNIKADLSDEFLLNMYANRWEIEIFFKLLKANFKFSNMHQHNPISDKKTYICNLIIILITTYLKNMMMDIKKITSVKNINTTNLIRGFFSENLIEEFINEKFRESNVLNFCDSYIKITKNKKNRHFLRISKRPFSKWYVKKFSLNSSYLKIIKAHIKRDPSDLHANEKVKYNKIIKIDIIDKKQFG